MGDDVALSAVAKPASEFKKTGPTEKRDKLKDANAIQKIEGWRALIFARLVEVESPWIDHAAVAALTGCRPAEVASVRIERIKNALVITIPGAKVSETKGQPIRRFTIAKDAGPEFAHLLERVKSGPVILSSDSTASAFSEALKRAGKQALGDKAPTMTGYVYRHALACDMKADGADRNEIAAALGHAVTKTQSHYGRASGGTKGARVFQIEAERPIKQTHGTGHRKGRDIAPTNAPEPAPVKVSPHPDLSYDRTQDPQQELFKAETAWFHIFKTMIDNGDVARMGPYAVTVYLVIKSHTNFATGRALSCSRNDSGKIWGITRTGQARA